jgi:hypothetical protein
MRGKTSYLASYSQTMQRVYWAEFIDNQLRPPRQFRASLVSSPFVPVEPHQTTTAMVQTPEAPR